MRLRQQAAPRRRSAQEWTQILADLHKSGLSPEQFAAERGISLDRLRWWRWHLTPSRPVAKAPRDDLRLLPVVVEPLAPAASPPHAVAWEISTAHGDVLRVYRAAAPAELQVVLAALLARGARR